MFPIIFYYYFYNTFIITHDSLKIATRKLVPEGTNFTN